MNWRREKAGTSTACGSSTMQEGPRVLTPEPPPLTWRPGHPAEGSCPASAQPPPRWLLLPLHSALLARPGQSSPFLLIGAEGQARSSSATSLTTAWCPVLPASSLPGSNIPRLPRHHSWSSPSPPELLGRLSLMCRVLEAQVPSKPEASRMWMAGETSRRTHTWILKPLPNTWSDGTATSELCSPGSKVSRFLQATR